MPAAERCRCARRLREFQSGAACRSHIVSFYTGLVLFLTLAAEAVGA